MNQTRCEGVLMKKMVFLLFLLTIFLFRFSHVSTAVAAESGLLHNPDLIFKIIKPFSPLKDSLAILKKKFSMRRLICSSSAGKCRAILSYEGDPRAQLLIGSKNGMVDFINLSIVVKNDILEQMDDYSFVAFTNKSLFKYSAGSGCEHCLLLKVNGWMIVENRV